MYRDYGRDDPVADAEEYASRESEFVGYCETCGQAIYKGDDYLDIDGTYLHDDYDCTAYWLKQFKVRRED